MINRFSYHIICQTERVHSTYFCNRNSKRLLRIHSRLNVYAYFSKIEMWVCVTCKEAYRKSYCPGLEDDMAKPRSANLFKRALICLRSLEQCCYLWLFQDKISNFLKFKFKIEKIYCFMFIFEKVLSTLIWIIWVGNPGQKLQL